MRHRVNQRTPDGRVLQFGKERLTFGRRTSGHWRCHEHPEWGLLTQSQVDGRKNAQFPKGRVGPPKPKPEPKPAEPVVHRVRRDIRYDVTCPECGRTFYLGDDGLTNCPKCSALIDIRQRY